MGQEIVSPPPTPFDQLSKNLLGALYRMIGQVTLEMEVFGAAQSIDVVFLPDQTRAAARGRLGLLGRMADDGPCLFEPFSTTPTLLDVRACVRKQYTLDHIYARQANRSPDQVVFRFPRLWVLSAGQPETVIAQYELRPMQGWPAGFWHGRPADPLHVVTLRTLPRQRDTLLLRLMGRGVTFRDAVDDLAALPEDAWERQLALPLLVAFRMDIPQDLLEVEEMNSLQRWEALYAEWERKVKAEGRQDALDEVERILAQREQQLREESRREAERLREDSRREAEQLVAQREQQLREDSRREAEQLVAQREQQLREDSVRHVLLDLLGERFGALPADAVERIQGAGLGDLERWTRRVVRAQTLADVLAA